MRYLGGKARWANAIARELSDVRARRFVDAMCGGLNVTAAMSGPRLANDACVPLVRLYEAWREGWRPPTVTEDLYAEVKAKQDPNDPLTAFVGFGCSYSGAWFNGFARDTKPRPKVPFGENFAASARRSLDRKLSRCSSAVFSSLDYRALDVAPGDLVYFDPEYQGTKRYAYFNDVFDHVAFVHHLDTLAAGGVTVYVSEYKALSATWEPVATFTSGKRSSTAGSGTETLFRVQR